MILIIYLTKQPQSLDTTAAARENRETGAPEIEISQAMLAAGMHIIAEEYGVCGMDIAPDLASDVFKAMCAQKDRG